MKKVFMGLIEKMRVNAEGVTVLLARGGSVLVPVDEGEGPSADMELEATSRVVRPEFAVGGECDCGR